MCTAAGMLPSSVKCDFVGINLDEYGGNAWIFDKEYN